MLQSVRILDSPEDMVISATMTGCTTLKSFKYNNRFNISKELVHDHTPNIQSKLEYKPFFEGDDPWAFEKIKPKKKKKKELEIIEIIPVINVIKLKKTREYSIDKKKVTHKIRGFVNQMKGEKQLYFWTITFPLKTTDDTAFILFNKWLTRLRFENMIRSYLWVTERQENGTIHYHIAINHRMDIKKSNRYMRACIFTSIDNQEIQFSRSAAKNYNGVDISKNRKTKRVTNFAKQKKQKSLSNYLTKYITKNNSTFSHLAWHCSRDYSNLVTSVRITMQELQESKFELELNQDKILEDEWFTFKRWKSSPPKILLAILALTNQRILSVLHLN